MMERYIAVIPLHGALASPLPDAPPFRWAGPERDWGLAPVYSGPDLFLAASPGLPFAAIGGEGGHVIGTIHPRDAKLPPPRDIALARLAGRQLESSDLLREFWGNYVAFLHAPCSPGTVVLRAPFGSLPCLYARHENRLLIASDVAVLRSAGLPPPGIDEAALLQRMAFRDLQTTATSLSGVQNLPGGRRLRIAGTQVDNEEAWSPWHAAGKQRWYKTRSEAEREIRTAVMQTVRACRAGAARPLLLLSGGLDSSILAACLSSLGGGYAAINLVRRDSIADERQFARLVAAYLGAQLIESEWDIGHIDLARADAAAAEPNARLLMQSTNQLVTDVAARIGADLTIDGGGGDNAFLGIPSVAPVTDALLHSQGIDETWEAARSMATIANVGVQQVLRRALTRLFRRSRSCRRHRSVELLSPEAAAGVPLLADHPWLAAPRRAEAGTAAHIALFATSQSWAEAPDLVTPLRHASPLASQPVVEACLGVPSWWWFRGGTNRIVVRDAFADRLPVEIAMRRSKGAPDSFAADIYAAHRLAMREILLGGHLRRRGMIDLNAIDALTGSEALLSDAACERILYLTQVEAWIAEQTRILNGG